MFTLGGIGIHAYNKQHKAIADNTYIYISFNSYISIIGYSSGKP